MSDVLDEITEEAVYLMEEAVYAKPVPGTKPEPGPCKCFKIPAMPPDYPEKNICFKSMMRGALTQEQIPKLCPEADRQYLIDGLGKRIAILRRSSSICKAQVVEKEKGTRWPLWWSCMGKILPKIAREIEKEPIPPPPAPKPAPKPEVKPAPKPKPRPKPKEEEEEEEEE